MTLRHPAAPEPGQVRRLIDELHAYCEILREPPSPHGGDAALGTTTLCVWGLVIKVGTAPTIAEACQPTLHRLQVIAHAVVSALPTAMPAECEPFTPVIYESRQAPGTDEICTRLTFRSRGSDPEVARQLKAGVHAIGLSEGQWHRQGEEGP